MSQSSEIYYPGILPENPEASQPLDLQESLRIRDGLELSHPKLIEGHILQYLRASLDRFSGVCFN